MKNRPQPFKTRLTHHFTQSRTWLKSKLFTTAKLKNRKISQTEMMIVALAWLIIPGGSLLLLAYYSVRKAF